MRALPNLDFVLTEHERDALDGELLGDGCLYVGKKYKNAQFQLLTAHAGQADFAHRALERLGGHVYKYFRRTNYAPNGCWSFTYVSSRHKELTAQRARWYPAGTKEVPADFQLTPVSALHWYIGDGSLDRDRPKITLCTDGFSYTSIGHLLEELVRCGFRPTVTTRVNGHRRIRLGAEDAARWLSWLGPCPVPKLAHKWRLKESTRRCLRVPADWYSEIEQLYCAGHSFAEIGAHFGRHRMTIESVVKRLLRRAP